MVVGMARLLGGVLSGLAMTTSGAWAGCIDDFGAENCLRMVGPTWALAYASCDFGYAAYFETFAFDDTWQAYTWDHSRIDGWLASPGIDTFVCGETWQSSSGFGSIDASVDLQVAPGIVHTRRVPGASGNLHRAVALPGVTVASDLSLRVYGDVTAECTPGSPFGHAQMEPRDVYVCRVGGSDPICPRWDMGSTVPQSVPAGGGQGVLGPPLGSCSPGSYEDSSYTYLFTAPAAGSYTFETVQPGSVISMSLRDGATCAGVELACTTGEPYSPTYYYIWAFRITEFLTAGQQVVLITDVFSAAYESESITVTGP